MHCISAHKSELYWSRRFEHTEALPKWRTVFSRHSPTYAVLKYHWYLFWSCQLAISQHRYWLSDGHATNHCLNQFCPRCRMHLHYCDVIMGSMASQITSLTIVYSTVHSGRDPRKHQRSASLAFVRGIHRRLVNSPHKWSVTLQICPFDDVIMTSFFV